MNNLATAPTANDSYVEQVKTSRNRPATLKLKLVSLKSSTPKSLIFVFEGKDDKVIYYNWIRRIKDEIRYEPFPCEGKKYVLQLIGIVRRDLNNLENQVYFFLDRDFDENTDIENAQNIYITDTYSIENSVINSEVVEELLKNDFHCHAEPEIRREIIELFNTNYAEFLEATKDINLRLYTARKLGIELTKQLPDKINQIAKVEIRSTTATTVPANDIVRLSREPDAIESAAAAAAFAQLVPNKHYRGKFAMMFFKRWLQNLVDDKNKPVENRELFTKLNNKSTTSPITLDSMASKSNPPPCLRSFIAGIPIPTTE
ncbi:DUF4435 domain-containing protein [Pseudomonas aeruginosa]|uniref:DUF4435 domain-containing protein n=1 Tax=Pseudomonas aeruginosa TaxID=287 RepID=UPI0009AC33B4|nr:DUF4435 domain-containing protein [Pseudomonas aeruginosa]MBG6564474.1 DUF4435 domain-containing protein [Pseudomonas aeruginosa]MCT1273090.1 DUF4435 domain-containing protein [Pseudomonas aeruginosa]MDS9676550.1 DUF4435 domain-containing protein [Pseudomonas aeruginosa]OPE25850.1 hypothetical protein APB09_28920 [Pseudomonas aeruginosa]HCF1165702.1 DUF4435 domain-containing protein [Pseudomonas aeruginosa]